VALTPFSYVVLVLVGRNGAGAHDLRRMSEQGRVFWSAAPSHWYSEPKRLAEMGLLDAQRGPGRTRQRTHYTLTDAGRAALEEWTRTPAPLPRMQHESVVRLLAADLVAPESVLSGLEEMDEAIDRAIEHLRAARRVWEPGSPHRAHLLRVNYDYAIRLMELQREWLADARAVLAAEPATEP
jgi:DNA-binding PadR family transcriptional regulator